MCERSRPCLVVALLCALLLTMLPGKAYALNDSDIKIGWGPNVVPGPSGGGGGGHPIEGEPVSSGGGAGVSFDGTPTDTRWGVMCVAKHRYQAAMLVCGYNWDDSRFDAGKRARLSNQTTGGDFWELASYFYTLSSIEGAYKVPDFYGNEYKNQQNLLGVCTRLGKLYGNNYVWCRVYTQELLDGAKAKVREILENESGGSGEGSGGDTGEVETDGTYYYLPFTEIINSGIGMSGFAVKANEYKNAVSKLTDNSDYSIYLGIGLWRNNSSYYNTLFCTITDVQPVTNDGNRLYQVAGARNFGTVTPSKQGTVTYDGNTWVIVSSIPVNANYNSVASDTLTNVQPLYAYYWGDGGDTSGGGGSGGGGDDDPVTGDWPDDDEPTPTPTPPQLPEPGDPTIPVQPTPDPPDPPELPGFPYPNPTTPVQELPDVESDVSFTADLQGIIDALNEHCIHLQERMVDCTEYMTSNIRFVIEWEGNQILARIDQAMIYLGEVAQTNSSGEITNINQQIAWLESAIGADFDNLLQYLEDLWGWLQETLVFDFTSEGYDDGSLLSWLERIYDKLGEGINTQPVDPVSDPSGTGSWLDQFLASFFGTLAANLAAVLAEAAGTLSALTTKFPISLPWDIMAILGLLVSPPVCPQVSIPCYSLTATGLQQVGTYEIDLQAVEFAVEGIRWMMRLGFVLLLARHTKDFLELIERVID